MLGRAPAVLFIATLLTGCSTSPVGSNGAGEVCGSTSECATGSCLGLAVYPPDGGACSVAAMACSKTCSDDIDCASLGTSIKCFDGCPGGQSGET
jgi:hypothetical protein